MDNLKLARIFLYLGIAVGASIPITVITNQSISAKRRKESIIKDQERIQKKLSENPNLRFRTDTSPLPISEDQLNSILNPKNN